MEKFSIRDQAGEEFLETKNIICLVADGSYTYIYTQVEGSTQFMKHFISGNLSKFERRLKALACFCRISRKAIVNLRFVQFKGRDNYIQLKIKCAEGLRISKNYRARFNRAMQQMQVPAL